MATHASSHLRSGVGARPAPRIIYDVRHACLVTGASIVALLVLFAILWMI